MDRPGLALVAAFIIAQLVNELETVLSVHNSNGSRKYRTVKRMLQNELLFQKEFWKQNITLLVSNACLIFCFYIVLTFWQ